MVQVSQVEGVIVPTDQIDRGKGVTSGFYGYSKSTADAGFAEVEAIYSE
jgi:hypothetical protein